jgi:hypothetical protein
MKKYIITILSCIAIILNCTAQKLKPQNKKESNPYVKLLQPGTLVIFNNKIYTTESTEVKKILQNGINKEKGDKIQVINDENSKSPIKHILIITTSNN